MILTMMVTLTKMVAFHLHEESSSSMVCKNGKKNARLEKTVH